MENSHKYDFFIIRHEADSKWAEWIAWFLEEHAGKTVFLQDWDFVPGADFVQKMQKGTTECKRTILVLTEDFIKAEFTQPEWGARFVEDPKGEKSLLIPIRVKECRPPGLLKSRIYVNLVGLNEKSSREKMFEMVDAIEKGRLKPKSAPKFPEKSSPIVPQPDFPLVEQEIDFAPLFLNCSLDLLEWPRTLNHGEWIEREELNDIESRISSSPSTSSLLLGSPGSGKSALLAHTAHFLKEKGYNVLAIKSDIIPTSVDSNEKLTDHLNLPFSIQQCVRKVARSQKVIVLVDQLDALADLTDLKSERLNVILDLVKELAGIPNVHIICSSREFEYQHDVRLSSIDADLIRLNLPTWEQISEILKQRDIDSSHWPEEFQNLLRSPQHLKIFLERLWGTGEKQIYSSYQLMLDDVWQRNILDPGGLPGRSQLLTDMAEQMAIDEILWLPVVQFEDKRELLDDLISTGILARPNNGPRIGFAHQTLFEHARARAFAQGQMRLADYVLERQKSLFVRPTLWSSLNYLREADPAGYQREMEQLCSTDLRLHLNYLLIDFLGHLDNPNESENRWFLDFFNQEKFRNKCLHAIQGQKEWFNLLKDHHIPAIMGLSTTDAWPSIVVLSPAFQFAASDCLDLIRQYWLPHKEYDELTMRTLDSFSGWDVETVDWLCRIVQRTKIPNHLISMLTTNVSAQKPDFAPRIVAADLKRQFRELESTVSSPEEIINQDNIFVQPTTHLQEAFRKFIDLFEGWYELPGIAEAAPKAFLDKIWPLFVQVIEHVTKKPERYYLEYRRDYCYKTDLNETASKENYLLVSIQTALQTYAQKDPKDYVEFASKWESHDSMVIQRLLAHGIAECASDRPQDCLDFLMKDPRRFLLGNVIDRKSDTVMLISKITPHLNQADCNILENEILNLNQYVPGSEMEDFRDDDNRKTRLRLLKAFSDENQLSENTRILLEKESLAFPDYAEPDIVVRSGRVGSPMSSDKMASSTNDEIFELFETLKDGIEHRHLNNPFEGGSLEASRAFGEFARLHSDRAIALIERFQPNIQETPVAHALEPISKTECPDTKLFNLIITLNHRGFKSTDFRVEATRALDNRLEKNKGLPDQISELLEDWLSLKWADETEATLYDREDRTGQSPEPVLWHHGLGAPLPYGKYQVLHTLTYAYLMKENPQTDKWLSMLESYLTGNESNDATWVGLSHDLKWLVKCNSERAEEFLMKLLDKHPAMWCRLPGAILLTHVWVFLSESSLRKIFRCIRYSDWVRGEQAFGELLCLHSLWFEDQEWSLKKMNQLLEENTSGSNKNTSVCTGIAFAAGHLWPDQKYRKQATDILAQLISSVDESISYAIIDLFRATEQLLADNETHQLLQELVNHPDVLKFAQNDYLVEHLADLLPSESELIYQLCHQLVRLHGQELQSYQTSFAGCAPYLVNISLTLQRQPGDLKSKGLDLFEDLLVLGVHDAQTSLDQLDLRSKNIIRQTPRRRRRRRKQ